MSSPASIPPLQNGDNNGVYLRSLLGELTEINICKILNIVPDTYKMLNILCFNNKNKKKEGRGRRKGGKVEEGREKGEGGGGGGVVKGKKREKKEEQNLLPLPLSNQ